MSEHAWLTILTILATLACCLISIIAISIRNGKKELKEYIKTEIDRLCESNTMEHNELWDRVNHHSHNTGGNVVIPTAYKSGG